VEELYGTRYQRGSFSLINVGSGFHCLRSFFPLTLSRITLDHWHDSKAVHKAAWTYREGSINLLQLERKVHQPIMISTVYQHSQFGVEMLLQQLLAVVYMKHTHTSVHTQLTAHLPQSCMQILGCCSHSFKQGLAFRELCSDGRGQGAPCKSRGLRFCVIMTGGLQGKVHTVYWRCEGGQSTNQWWVFKKRVVSTLNIFLYHGDECTTPSKKMFGYEKENEKNKQAVKATPHIN